MNSSLKPFDTTGFNIFFKRELKEIKTGIDDIDFFLTEHFKLQRLKREQSLRAIQTQQQHNQPQQPQQPQQQPQPQPKIHSNQTIQLQPPNLRIHNTCSNSNNNNNNNNNNINNITIQPYQPINPGIIELYGPSGSGKTETALEILVNSILPSCEPFNGNEIGVIYFDNDFKFDILKLEILLQKKYSQCILKNSSIKNNNNIHNSSSVEFQQFLKSCLSRLYLVRCKDSFQFLVTLNGINQFIRNINNNSNSTTNNNNNNNKKIKGEYPNDISLIIIDSISAFFWIDQKGEPLNIKPNSLWIEAIKRILNDNIIIVATKQTIFSLNNQNNNNSTATNNDNSGNLSLNQPNINKYLHMDQHREFLGVEWTKLVKFRKIIKPLK
ncbi:hypothetical protein ACTFIV_008262 [Dictyostelium citrinum]